MLISQLAKRFEGQIRNEDAEATYKRLEAEGSGRAVEPASEFGVVVPKGVTFDAAESSAELIRTSAPANPEKNLKERKRWKDIGVLPADRADEDLSTHERDIRGFVDYLDAVEAILLVSPMTSPSGQATPEWGSLRKVEQEMVAAMLATVSARFYQAVDVMKLTATMRSRAANDFAKYLNDRCVAAWALKVAAIPAGHSPDPKRCEHPMYESDEKLDPTSFVVEDAAEATVRKKAVLVKNRPGRDRGAAT
ncbi:hypothetical protein N9411_00620 [bacterium]|nr:hypothetical protein [bacterium]